MTSVTVEIEIGIYSCAGEHRKIAEKAFLSELRRLGESEEIIQNYPGGKRPVIPSSEDCYVAGCDRRAQYFFYHYVDRDVKVPE
jgi:hypothetical protein